MSSLSKREKVLLYILLCVIIFIGGVFFLVLPSLDKITTLKANLTETNNRLLQASSSQVDTTDADKTYNELKKQYEELRKKYFIDLKVEDVDNKITQLALKYKLVPKNLAVDQIGEEEVLTYAEYLDKLLKESEANGSANTDKNQKQDDEVKKEEDDKDAVKDMISVYNVTLSIDGSIANLQAMVDEVNKSSSMKINSVSYDEQVGTKKEMNVSFKVYMLEKEQALGNE